MSTTLVYYDLSTTAKKTRVITIYKDRVYLDVDSITYKFMEAQKAQTDSQENAIASDIHEGLDNEVVHFCVDHQDGLLRKRFAFAFADGAEIESVDNSDTGEGAFVYEFNLPESFKDSALKGIAMLIHDFLVWGALRDWYLALGYTAQANALKGKLDEVEESLASSLRTPSWAKRPLQPFGPARKRNL